MKNNLMRWGVVFTAVLMTGCAVESDPLGGYVAKMRAEQTYNPDAAQQNAGYVPEGSGERMEKTYTTYTEKSDSKLSGTSSRVLTGN